MARVTKVVHLCDRCGKSIAEYEEHEAPVAASPILAVRYLREEGVEGFDWDELCPKCRRRVDNLLDLILMRGDGGEDSTSVTPPVPVDNGAPQGAP